MSVLRQRVGMLAAVGILTFLALYVLSLPSIQTLFAQSSIVNLQVPDTQIIVQGSSSPSALITVLKDGTETASSTANSAGTFTVPVTNLSGGIYTISVQATDISGNQTPFITRDVAVNLQQTSIATFFMPPTVSISESSLAFGQGSFIFETQGTPGASMQLIIGNQLRILTDIADANGRATFSLRSDSLSVGIFRYSVEASQNNQTSEPDTTIRTFLITPPIAQQQPIAATPPSTQVPTTQEVQTGATITSPLNGMMLPGSDQIITGNAPSGSEVLLYVDGILAGAVTPNQAGEWEFYFLPFNNRHVFSAQTCSGEICSSLSSDIEVFFEEIAGVCDLNFELQAYRLSGFINKQVHIRGAEELSIDSADIYVNWGERSSQQKFSLKNNEPLESEYTYQQPGLYNGYVIISDSNNCSAQRYFTAQIRDQDDSNYFELTVLLFVCFLGAIAYYRRSRALPDA